MSRARPTGSCAACERPVESDLSGLLRTHRTSRHPAASAPAARAQRGTGRQAVK
jgi:hypothetical protein